jgi:predicted glycosyltransferase
MTIGFLTQYYRGLGHSQRIKYIAEQTAKYQNVIVMDQLFDPPINISVPHVAFLKNFNVPSMDQMFKFIMQEPLIYFRIKRFIETIEKHNVSTLVCEGFPFCRQQFAHEYFRYFEECKKRNIKIVISVRDFPWDEPHNSSLQDWVLYTQNIVTKYYADKILVHGDEDLLPLISDRTRHANSKAVIDDIKDKLVYTGYVCDEDQPIHKKKNNNVFVSTGLNKDESVIIFKRIAEIAQNFPNFNFIMPVANKYRNIGGRKNKNIYLVEYVPELRNKLTDCAAYITYGGYNATTEILKGQIPSIVIPRQDGQKLEQFIRAYTFEPYDWYKVMNFTETKNIKDVLNIVLNDYKPQKFSFCLNGASNSAKFLNEIYTR